MKLENPKTVSFRLDQTMNDELEKLAQSRYLDKSTLLRQLVAREIFKLDTVSTHS